MQKLLPNALEGWALLLGFFFYSSRRNKACKRLSARVDSTWLSVVGWYLTRCESQNLVWMPPLPSHSLFVQRMGRHCARTSIRHRSGESDRPGTANTCVHGRVNRPGLAVNMSTCRGSLIVGRRRSTGPSTLREVRSVLRRVGEARARKRTNHRRIPSRKHRRSPSRIKHRRSQNQHPAQESRELLSTRS